MNETLSRLEQTPKLVIAAINGHCVGGGFEIALACDLRIARKSAGRLGLPEVNLGVLPGTGGTQRLTKLLGSSRALKLMIDGTTMNTSAALEVGLIHQEVGETERREVKGREREVCSTSRQDFIAAVLEIAQQYCSPKKASMAVGHIKRAVKSGGELPLEAGLTLERELQAKLFASHDADEGLSAFVEKRGVEFEEDENISKFVRPSVDRRHGAYRSDRNRCAQPVRCADAVSFIRRVSRHHNEEIAIQSMVYELLWFYGVTRT